ncbi:MAG: hypothetical protein DRI65_10400 [Chloroflexota bacterium]|nr:MAG: hypothetical protein DRI65_10400 [Chloroflexota bacterium]
MFDGCTTYRFKVDAIKAPGGSYRLESADSEFTQDDAHFREVAEFVKTALSSKGMFEAPPGVMPDMIVEVDLGIEATRTIQWMTFYPPFDGGQLVTVVIYKLFLQITARDEPRQGGDHLPLERWSTYVTIENEDDDLRKYVPLLVSAAMDSIDADTAGQKRITLRANDDRIAFVKAGM